MSTSEHYEQLLAFISTHLPTPYTQEEVEGVIVLTGGSPGEVIVRLRGSPSSSRNMPSRGSAVQAGAAAATRRSGQVASIPESRLMSVVGELIKGTREMRRSNAGPARRVVTRILRNGWRTTPCVELRPATGQPAETSPARVMLMSQRAAHP